MKNKIIIRKDIKISFNSLSSILVQAGTIINSYNKITKDFDILEVINKEELFTLEGDLIENGLFFEWLIKEKELIGIVVIENDFFLDEHNIVLPYKKYEPDVLGDNVNGTLQDYKEKVILLSKDKI